MALGILRGELTSLLWGGAFGFVWVYVVLAGAWSGWRLRKHLPQAHPVATSNPPTLTFSSDPLPRAPALFSWRLLVTARHSASRQFVTRLQDELTLRPHWPRGRYEVNGGWELSDWFGLTRLTVPPRETAWLTVQPGRRDFKPQGLPEHRRGSVSQRRKGRRVGEPFDVRHYVPGDDLRRLHWPLYAHSDNLFVRTAESVPPPTGRQFIVLDLDAASEEALDFRLECLAGWLADLDARSAEWTVAVPTASLILRKETFDQLASLSPDSLTPALDAQWPDSVTLMTGSRERADALVRELVRSRRHVLPVVIADEPRPQLPTPWWKRR